MLTWYAIRNPSVGYAPFKTSLCFRCNCDYSIFKEEIITTKLLPCRLWVQKKIIASISTKG